MRAWLLLAPALTGCGLTEARVPRPASYEGQLYASACRVDGDVNECNCIARAIEASADGRAALAALSILSRTGAADPDAPATRATILPLLARRGYAGDRAIAVMAQVHADMPAVKARCAAA